MIKVGDNIEHFILPTHEGEQFDSGSFAGRRALLAFMRFARCPFCNLRIHRLVELSPSLPEGFLIVAVFESSTEGLREAAARHHAPFPILADEKGEVHRRYGITQSFGGLMKGMIMRMPTLLKAIIIHRYWPFPISGSMTTMPADFLIDEKGIVRMAHYGRDEGDHLPLEEIVSFASTSPAEDS